MGFGRTLKAMLLSPLVKQRLRPLFSKPNRDDLESIAQLVADGRVSPVIDRTHALENINAAMNHIGSRHTQGKTVVTI
jgi:NADPH:quinone reductase-like Zn-dependent oxidoreductase